ncbi:hypothetical protein Y032_0003g1266 [Ancylostoma ceylanicum]|uniref:Uncharacterized protein n=1 Tax=Ancylostoma ceylanicum TaxID=53326 RepID=A0A016VWX6_9BILA|nr:hypothetical protein Y032_0003g1266 [Ancylostoma ceylanicum]
MFSFLCSSGETMTLTTCRYRLNDLTILYIFTHSLSRCSSHVKSVEILNEHADPSEAWMDYRPGVLSGRQIYWCPDGQGHLPYCPSPSDSDENIYCCQFFTFGGDTFPSCCRFPIYTGVVYALVISAVLLFLCSDAVFVLLVLAEQLIKCEEAESTTSTEWLF